jgi:general secretion pathway protein N
MKGLVVFAFALAPIVAAHASENNALGDSSMAARNGGVAPADPTTSALPHPLAAAATHDSPLKSNPLSSIPLSALSETRDRPLFSVTRRPPPADAAVGAVAKASVDDKSPGPELPPFVLKGTVLGSNDRVAVLLDPATNRTSQLRLGKSDSGWTVLSVSPRSIVLRKGELLTTLELPRPSAMSAEPVIKGAIR